MAATVAVEEPLGTYAQRFEDIVSRFPDRVAFRLKTAAEYRQVTYREVYRQSRGIAFGLRGLRLETGARVAILSENRPEWVVAYLGIFFAGGTAVPLDTQISPQEWRRLADDSEAQVVFVSGSLVAKLRGAVEDSYLRSRIICFDPMGGDYDARTELSGFLDWAGSLEPVPRLTESRPDDVVVIIYTSGTTGRPKGVMLTQANILSEIRAIRDTIYVDENDAFLCLLPLQHVFAAVVNFLTPLYFGAHVVFVDTLRRSEILQALREAGITILATVPQFFYLFHDRIQDELAARPVIVRALFARMLGLNRFCLRVLRMNLGKLFFGKVHRNFGAQL